MSFRFYPRKVRFDHDIRIPPRISQEDATELVRQGEIDELIDHHCWLAIDIAQRALAKLELPAHLGEELAAQGLVALGKAVPKLNAQTRNIRAFLSWAIEKGMVDFLGTDALCHVPARTQRDQRAKGKLPAVAPKFAFASDLAESSINDKGDEIEETEDETLSRFAPQSSPSRIQHPEDFYQYCRDVFDMDIVELRYDDGAGPRCLDEVADIIGLDRSEIERRLEAIETRVYRDLCRRKPAKKRSPGKRFFRVPANLAGLVQIGGGIPLPAAVSEAAGI